jgi:hypothetical protein
MSMAQARGLYTDDSGPRYERAFDKALALLRDSADQWAEGNPEVPPTEATLRRLLDIFVKEKFLRIPFGAGPS